MVQNPRRGVIFMAFHKTFLPKSSILSSSRSESGALEVVSVSGPEAMVSDGRGAV